MKYYFNFIHWAGLDNVSSAILIGLMVVTCMLFRWHKANKALKYLSSKRLRSLLILNASLVRRCIKYFLSFIGFLFLLLALLKPQWNKKEEQVAQEGRDLLIAVDISRSMLCADVKPNRLEFAKQKIKKLLYNLKCERVGLLLFSGETVLQCPLTSDYAAFFMFLDNLDVETISSGTTTIDGVISRAISLYESMQNKKTKLLCVFTDGEDFSNNLSGIKAKAQETNLSIFTFGIGSSSGAPIPIIDMKGKIQGFEKDSKGSVVMSKLNEGILQNLSDQTGGKYIHAVDNDFDIQELIRLVEQFEKDAFEDVTMERYQEQYPYFVSISFICFVLEWLL